MGTNYYRVAVLTEDKKKKLYELIEQEKWHSSYDEENDPESSVTNMINSFDEGVHICKMSYGWQTCFDHNWGEYYQPNRKSLEDFLSEDGYIIRDEYGDTYTPEEFWKIVDERNASQNNSWTSKSYDSYAREKNPNYKSYPCITYRNKVYDKFGIKCDADDFTVDGLRFAVYTDFS